MLKNIFAKIRNFFAPRIPFGCKICMAISLVCLIIHVLATKIPAFADFITYSIGTCVRFTLAKLTA